MTAPYIDTSALAKWYIGEDRSEDVESYLRALPEAAISGLTVVELRCLLARRRRNGDFTIDDEAAIFSAFQGDIIAGHLIVYPLAAGQADDAVRIIDDLAGHPLRSLDALHLAVARAIEAPVIATADRIMAESAGALEFDVAYFGS